MFKTTLSLFMVTVLLQVGILSGFAASRGDISETQVSKIKADIAKRGMGEKATVQVKLRSNKQLKGYISEAGEDRFTLTMPKVNESIPVAYSDVLEVKKPTIASSMLFVLGFGAMATGAVVVIASGW